LPLPAGAQQQQTVEWAKLPPMQLERQYAAPLQDTVIQRWRDPVDGTICYIYLPIRVVHSPPTGSGYLQCGPNTIGSMSCVAASAAAAPPSTSALTSTMLVSLIIQLVAGIAGGKRSGPIVPALSATRSPAPLAASVPACTGPDAGDFRRGRWVRCRGNSWSDC
jgi:hypothetical protein